MAVTKTPVSQLFGSFVELIQEELEMYKSEKIQLAAQLLLQSPPFLRKGTGRALSIQGFSVLGSGLY